MKKILLIICLFGSIITFAQTNNPNKKNEGLRKIIKDKKFLYTYCANDSNLKYHIIRFAASDTVINMYKLRYHIRQTDNAKVSVLNWDIEDNNIFSIEQISHRLLVYCPIDSLLYGHDYNIDYEELNKSFEDGTYFKKFKDFDERYSRDRRQFSIIGLYPITEHKRKNKIYFDFTVLPRWDVKRKVIYGFALYILADKKLIWYNAAVTNSKSLKFEPVGLKKRQEYEADFSDNFFIINQDTSIFLDDKTFLMNDSGIFQIKNDTIIRTGRITKDTLKDETLVSQFFIDDKDNEEILLFPPYYFVKENEEAPKIRTLNEDDELYNLTMKMANKYFRKEDD